VEAHHIVHGDGEEAIGVVVPKVVLDGEIKKFNVPERLDVLRPDAAIVHLLSVKGHAFVGCGDDFLQPVQLNRFDAGPVHGLRRGVPDHGASSLTVLPCYDAGRGARQGWPCMLIQGLL
jgi:hypothetical protein